MSTLTLTNLNLPDNPTARRLLDLIGEYQVRYVLLEDGVRFTSSDISEAKGHDLGDFVRHFLPNLTTDQNGNLLSNPNDVWVLEGEALKEFKDIYKEQLGISLGRINKLTVVGWNTAYHYLVQGHSNTAKDFSNLAYDHFLEDLTSKSEGTNTNNENLPPLPNNATARRFMELVEQYNLSCYEWVEKFWYIGSDLCEAKGSHKWDFANNFLGTNPKYEYLKLEGENLKAFKKSLPQEKYEKLKFAPSLYLADWNTAYHYLVQGHSETAKDFSNLGADSVADSFKEESDLEDPILADIERSRRLRLKQIEIEKEQQRQAKEQLRQAQKILEQAKELAETTKTANEAKAGLQSVRNELASLKEFAIAQPEGLDQDKVDLINQAFQQLGAVLKETGVYQEPSCYQKPWKQLGLTMRNSSINYDLNARLANAKKKYKVDYKTWEAIGKPRGQAPKKPTAISILIRDNKLTDAFKAAQQVIKANLAKLTS